MKIGFDAKRLFNNFTGLGNYSRTLVKNFQQSFPEHDLHLFSPKLIRNEETEWFFDESRFTLHECKHPFKGYWRQYQITSLVKKLDLDIYHGLSHELPIGIEKLNCKTFISFHDLIYEHYPEQFPLLDRFFYRRKYKSSAFRADQILAISESTKKDLKEIYGIPENKISVLYQSCQDIFFQQKTYVKPIKEEHYFLYVGSIIERKGLLKIVEAQALIPVKSRIPIVIIGSGKDYVQEVKERISALGLDNDFLFMKYVENHLLPSYYHFAKALIFPSVYEGFGIPIIESLLSNTPVITSSISSLPEAAGPGGILVNPSNQNEIAKAMVEISEDEKKAAILSTKGRQHVLSKFTSKVLSQELLKLYQSIK